MAEPVNSINNNDDSPTLVVESQSLKKGDYCILNDKPFRILAVSWSKPGKVGHPKVMYVGTDLLTGKKTEDLVKAWTRGHHPVTIPKTVTKTEYILIGFNDNDDHLRLLPVDENGDPQINENVLLPAGHLGEGIKTDFVHGKQLLVMVHSILGHEGVVSYRENSLE